MRCISTIMLLGTLSLTAYAGPITYELVGVTFADGATATGSFTFDADAGTPCSGGSLVCGVYSNIDIVTTQGSGPIPAATFTLACFQDVPTCTGLPPNSTGLLLLSSNATDQTGLPALAFSFSGPPSTPPSGLSDAGGVFDVSGSSVGLGLEGLCVDATCSSPSLTNPVVAGLVATPEPSTMLVLGASLGILGLFARLRLGWE
jgi:hypothetical protein